MQNRPIKSQAEKEQFDEVFVLYCVVLSMCVFLTVSLLKNYILYWKTKVRIKWKLKKTENILFRFNGEDNYVRPSSLELFI